MSFAIGSQTELTKIEITGPDGFPFEQFSGNRSPESPVDFGQVSLLRRMSEDASLDAEDQNEICNESSFANPHDSDKGNPANPQDAHSSPPPKAFPTSKTPEMTWLRGETWVSRLPPEEFSCLLALKPPEDLDQRIEEATKSNRLLKASPSMAFPPRFDWREQGGVTPVKNQGMCGSCWAFAAAAAFESQILIRTGVEEDISEQAVIECNPYNHGCSGGWMSTAYDLWMSSGAVRESCMPYHERDNEQCIAPGCESVGKINDYYYVGDSVEDLKQALLGGPITVAMAVCGDFASYIGGCYEDNCTEVNHAVTLVGWDDTLCGGVWIVKNSWGPDWGMGGYAYIRYRSCRIGYGAQALVFNPEQTVHLFHHSHTIDDSEGNGDGFIDVGEMVSLEVALLNIGAETATDISVAIRSLSSGVDVFDSVASAADIPKGEIGTTLPPHLSFVVRDLDPNKTTISFLFEARSNQGQSSFVLKLQLGQLIKVFEDDLETDRGWTVGEFDDDATRGIWERADPQGTWWGNQPVQPDEDNTENGTTCYVTGALAGDYRGSYDVDGGKTTLLSPMVDLSYLNSAVVTYYRWYSSNTGQYPNDDDFIVDVSNDGGLTWHNLETLSYDDRVWRKRQFHLEEILPLTSEMRFRFIAQDRGLGGSIVEAAIDDFSIVGSVASLADTIPPSVLVVSPNGGEILTEGSEYSIQWDAIDQTGIQSISIFLSQDGGTTFQDTVANGIANNGLYLWHVPSMETERARIKIVARDLAGNVSEDISDGDFWLRRAGSGGSTELPDLPAAIVLRLADGNPVTDSPRLILG
ncbi:MAG: C1 family peptidase, partial [bacterium]